MQIYIRNLAGREIVIETEPTATIESIKQAFEDQEGIPVRQQRLYLGQTRLENDHTVADYQLKPNVRLTLQLCLRG